MKILLTSLFLMFTTSAPWLTDFSAAKATAEKENHHILLNFAGSDWCAPCIKMTQEVFESEAFAAVAAKELVLVRADFPRLKKHQLSKEQTRHNEALAEQYNPEGKFPYTLLLDADGKVIKTWDGYVYKSQQSFMAELNQALSTK